MFSTSSVVLVSQASSWLNSPGCNLVYCSKYTEYKYTGTVYIIQLYVRYSNPMQYPMLFVRQCSLSVLFGIFWLQCNRWDLVIRIVKQDQSYFAVIAMGYKEMSSVLYEPTGRGERGGVAGSQPMSTAVQRSTNKLWRSNFIFNLWVVGITYCSSTTLLPNIGKTTTFLPSTLKKRGKGKKSHLMTVQLTGGSGPYSERYQKRAVFLLFLFCGKGTLLLTAPRHIHLQ